MGETIGHKWRGKWQRKEHQLSRLTARTRMAAMANLSVSVYPMIAIYASGRLSGECVVVKFLFLSRGESPKQDGGVKSGGTSRSQSDISQKWCLLFRIGNTLFRTSSPSINNFPRPLKRHIVQLLLTTWLRDCTRLSSLSPSACCNLSEFSFPRALSIRLPTMQERHTTVFCLNKALCLCPPT